MNPIKSFTRIEKFLFLESFFSMGFRKHFSKNHGSVFFSLSKDENMIRKVSKKVIPDTIKGTGDIGGWNVGIFEGWIMGL